MALPENDEENEAYEQTGIQVDDTHLIHSHPIPLPKRCKLSVPACEAHQIAKEARLRRLGEALQDINKLIKSKLTLFDAGEHGLQAKRVRAIQSYLWMVVKNKQKRAEAAAIAAESQWFARDCGSRLVQKWVRAYVATRELPTSAHGVHKKAWSLLDDPVIAEEMRSYLWSNKWCMNPAKLVDFTKNKLLPEEADKYIRHIVHKEMPVGLKQYLEVELFPRIHHKVKSGISLVTACEWMLKVGFKYTSHKKAPYYDQHEASDVVDYRQNDFLPKMEKHQERLVGYVVGDIEKQIEKTLPPGVKKLILVAHDEMTAQANDTNPKEWVLDGEHRLRKKGVGHGLHQSDVICSTKGWLSEALNMERITMDIGMVKCL